MSKQRQKVWVGYTNDEIDFVVDRDSAKCSLPVFDTLKDAKQVYEDVRPFWLVKRKGK